MARYMTCFGMGGTIPRVHICDNYYSREVVEMGVGGDGQWYEGKLVRATGAPWPSPAGYGSITCFGVGGQASRIYYVSDKNQVIELGWGDDGRWYAADISGRVQAPPVRDWSDITCFGVNGGASRVYYFGEGGGVIELAWQADGSWSWADISAAAGAPAADGDSALACFAAGGWATRIYYFDANAQVIEIGWSAEEEDWYFTAAGQAAGAAPSGERKNLTCFGVDGVTPRVYYVNTDALVVELGVGDDKAWYAGTLPIGEVIVGDASTLTCFGVDGRDTRLYFFDDNHALVEVGWGGDGRWYAGVIDRPYVSSSGPRPLITCFGIDGRTSAVYYITSTQTLPRVLVEVRFAGGAWVSNVVIEITL